MLQSTDKELWEKANKEFDRMFKSYKDNQIGGEHYRKYAPQPIEFALKNNLDVCQFSILKYVLRHKDKNGVEDLDKAIHMLKLYKELYYNA